VTEHRRGPWRGLLVTVAVGALGFLAALPVSYLVGCNVHELSHAAVATGLGWEVERVRPCLATGGGVTYSSIGSWAGNAQGYAGGLGAAVVLGLGYVLLLIWWRRLPVRDSATSALLWGAALAAGIWILPQVYIGVVEGRAGPGEDYTDGFVDRPWLHGAILLALVVAGVAMHRWLFGHLRGLTGPRARDGRGHRRPGGGRPASLR
jgi:hypothetical protein